MQRKTQHNKSKFHVKSMTERKVYIQLEIDFPMLPNVFSKISDVTILILWKSYLQTVSSKYFRTFVNIILIMFSSFLQSLLFFSFPMNENLCFMSFFIFSSIHNCFIDTCQMEVIATFNLNDVHSHYILNSMIEIQTVRHSTIGAILLCHIFQ